MIIAEINKCLICGSKQFSTISNEIREGRNIVLQCNDCDFVFLKYFKKVKYENDYGSMTLDENWNYKKQILVRSHSLIRTINYIVDVCKKYRYKKIGLKEVIKKGGMRGKLLVGQFLIIACQ